MPRALKFELSLLQLPTLHSCSRLVSRSQTHSQSLHGYARSAVAQHCPSPSYLLSPRGRSTFGKYFNAYLKFTVYGRKQARTYVNTLPQCSPASVGLAQARPNYPDRELFLNHKQFSVAELLTHFENLTQDSSNST